MREKWNAFNADLSNPKMHQKAGPIVIKNKVSADVVHMAAAAPDLLEALEATNKLLGDLWDGSLGTLDAAVAVQIAENSAALAKAYGESE